MTTKKVNPSYTDRASYQSNGENKQHDFELDQMDSPDHFEDGKNTTNLNGRITGYLALCLVTAAIGSAFQFGWSTAIFNTPEKVIQDFYRDVAYGRLNRNLTDSEMTLLWSVTSGMQPLGGIAGGFSSGFMADFFGRKRSLLMTNFFVLVTAVLLTISKYVKSYETVMIGRFFAGVICGLFSGLFPMYLNECSPVNLRGRIGVINQFSVVVGIFVVNVFGLSEVLGTSDLWPVLCAFTLLPSLAHIALFFTAESPKYIFMAKSNEDEARKLLLKLRANDQRLVNAEIDEMKDEKVRMAEQEKISWADMFKRVELRRALLVTVVIQMSQQFSGINAVIFFSTQIFVDAGLDWGTYATLLMSGMQIVMTFVCMLIIDKAGRKPLLLIGMIGMSLTCFGLVLTLVFKDEADWLSYITVVCVVLYIVFFSIGPGPIPWLLTGELFESDSRGKATSIAVLVNWTSNFIVVVTFNFMKDGIGDYSFVVYGALLIGFIIFTLFFVPETKGKSTEEVVATFKQKFIFFPK